MRSVTRIGFAGPIELRSSPHATWIRRGLEVAQGRLNAMCGGDLRLIARDDGASELGGRKATEHLLAQGADVLVGYFSSASGAAAVPLASRAGTPLVIAGATAESLTRAHGIYRTCDSEQAYAAWISELILRRRLDPVRIVAQSSPFGLSMQRALRACGVEGRCAAPLTLLFLGQADFVHAHCVRAGVDWRAPNLLLTDDCQHAVQLRRIAQALRPGFNIFVAGFSQQPSPQGAWALETARERWAAEPGAFFFETIAAIETAAHIARADRRQSFVQTVFGPLRLDARGEAHPRRFQLYTYRADQLRALPDA